ncbi:MAG TPA: Crp/Fnr family transcriptional regulator [Puia sp.]|nr:Crp/Fnr family transcriptional regulator [Puia sp.]
MPEFLGHLSRFPGSPPFTKARDPSSRGHQGIEYRMDMIRTNLKLLQLMDSLAVSVHSKGALVQRSFPERQRLITQEHQHSSVYVIKSGIVKCYITEENGKDYILEFLGEGEVLGEMEALRHTPGMCTVEAVTPLIVYKMSNTQFGHFLRTQPDFNATVMELLATRLANTAIKGARQQLYTLSHTLRQLLSALNSQHITFTKQHLSEYLGISIRSLNRLLKNLDQSE